MPLVLVLIATVALVAAVTFAVVRVGGAALLLRRSVRASHTTRLEALFAVDSAREHLTAAAAHTGERRAVLEAQLHELERARASIGLIVEAAGETLRRVRLPR